MPFDEAVELARLIRQAPGWHVLGIEAASGEKLEDDVWAVQALSDVNWLQTHYFRSPGFAARWQSFLGAWERQKRGETHEV